MTAPEAVFRFAHLSDPHLTDPSGARFRELAGKRALGYLSWRRRRRHEHRREFLDALSSDLQNRAPDHTVITGDLTHISLPQEFLEAREWLRSLGTAERITVVPGNHDCYVRMPWDQSLGLWSEFMRADSAEAGTGSLFPLVRIRGPVAFIGLSSAEPSPPLFATGRLGDEQLDRLDQALAALEHSGLLRVLMLHHPPVPGTERWRKRLVDAPELCSLLEKRPVDMVLHGHRHRPGHTLIKMTGRQIPVFGIPSASAAGLHCKHASEYNEYDVVRTERGWRVDVRARSWQEGSTIYREEQIARLEIGRSR
jgi:3',5'-cyclic AMP phosphodiesterase CpdA